MSVQLAVVIDANTKTSWPMVKDLLLQNLTVVGLTKSLQNAEMLKTLLKTSYSDAFHTRECDFNSLDAIKTAILWIMQKFPAAREITIHAHQKNNIDRILKVTDALVGCKTIWRRADIMD